MNRSGLLHRSAVSLALISGAASLMGCSIHTSNAAPGHYAYAAPNAYAVPPVGVSASRPAAPASERKHWVSAT